MAQRNAPKKSDALKELGASGQKIQTGLNYEDYLPELRGSRAVKTYERMRVSDPVIGAVLQAMDMLLRGVEWRTEAADDSDEALAESEFVESVLEDMSGTFEDFVSEVLSFLPFGWSAFETVYKRRQGLEQTDPTRRSRFNDGRIGLRKLAPRPQQTLERFEYDDNGGIQALIQTPMDGTQSIRIPIEKLLLFRTVTNSNSPTGRSVLRSAYRPWYFATHVESIESIAIERELNGLPVFYVPSDIIAASDGDQKKALDNYKQFGRDVKFNEQGYMILPSDPYEDGQGNPTNHRQVQFELVASEGTRNIDTGPVIQRYRQDMARTVLADFLMLGQSEKGSFALSKSKSDLFLKSLEGYLNSIAAVLNRHLLPRIWQLNGLNQRTMPLLVPGEVAPPDLDELGNYLQRVAGAGIPVGGDQEIEDAVLDAAGLPTEQRDDPDLIGRTEKRKVRVKAGSRRK